MLRHLPLICICMLICCALNAQPDLKKEYELIDSAWKKKDYNTVIDKATGIILKNRKEENAWIYWTYAHANLNKYQEAYDGYRELVTLDPESFDYHTGAGWYGVLAGQLDSALLHSNKAIDLNAYQYAPMINKAHALLLKKRVSEAVYFYDACMEMVTSREELERGPLNDFRLLDSLYGSPVFRTLAQLFRENFKAYSGNTVSNALLDSIVALSGESDNNQKILAFERKFAAAQETEPAKKPRLLARTYLNIARDELFRGNAFLPIIKKARDYALLVNDSLLVVNMCLVLKEDMLYLRDKYGEKKMLENALFFAEEAYSIAARYKIKDRIPKALFGYADMLHENGRYRDALTQFTTLLSLIDKKELPEMFKQTLNRLVLVHSSLSQVDSAKKYSMDLVAHLEKTGNRGYEYFMARKNMATILLNEKIYEEGMARANEVLRDFGENPAYSEELSGLCGGMGQLQAMNGKKNEARLSFERSIAYYKQYLEDFKKKNPENRAPFISNECAMEYRYLKAFACAEGRMEDYFRLVEETKDNLLLFLMVRGDNKNPTITLKEAQQQLPPDAAAISFSNVNDATTINSIAFTPDRSQLREHQIASLQKKVTDSKIDIRGPLKRSSGFDVAGNVANGYTSRFLPLLYYLQNTNNTGTKRGVIRKKNSADSLVLSDNTRRDVSRILYDFYIKPHEPLLEGKKTIYVSADLLLHYIPFETLIDEKGTYLGEQFNIIYVPSFTVLNELKKRKYNEGNKILAFGNADFANYQASSKEGRTGELENFGMSWGDLEGTAKELAMLGEQIQGTEIFEREKISESSIKKMSTGRKLLEAGILHFAVHGFGSIVTGEKDNLLVVTESPGGKEDGYLRFYEAYNLDINARLVTLSACETAFGTPTQDGSAASMVTAFLAGGAGSCIGTNWKVSDEASMLFMKEFYTLVQKKIPYPEALRQVRTKFIRGEMGKEYQHPFFWAPFKYFGF